MRIRRNTVAVALVLTGVATVAASGSSAREITRATITVGRGGNDARLDMTRREVTAHVGQPVWHSGPGVMSYMRPSDGIFDVYRCPDTGRVRMFIFAPGPPAHRRSWRLRDGNRIFIKGGIDRLRHRFGRRVHRWINPETGERSYVVCGRYHRRPVRTEFLVGRFSRAAPVSDVTILFTDRAADGSPLPDARCLSRRADDLRQITRAPQACRWRGPRIAAGEMRARPRDHRRRPDLAAPGLQACTTRPSALVDD